MNRALGLAIILGVLALSLIVVQVSQDYTSIIPIEQTTEISAEEQKEWMDFTDPDGKFKVTLPILPQHASERLGGRHYEMYISELPDQTIYMITLITFPLSEEKTDDMLLGNILQEAVRTNKENVLDSVKKGTFRNYRSLDYTIRNPQGSMHGKAFMKGVTMMILTQITRGANPDKANFDRFVNSFEVLS